MIKHMAWSPADMRIASVSDENKLRVWDAMSSETLFVYPVASLQPPCWPGHMLAAIWPLLVEVM